MSDSNSVIMLESPISTQSEASNATFQVVINKKTAKKKRKASEAILSSTIPSSENESTNSSQNSAFYLQKAINNLQIAFSKESDVSTQSKIQFLVNKT